MFYKSYFTVLSFFSLILILPIIGILLKVEFDISYFFDFINSKYNIKIIYITFIQAFFSAFFSCLLAIPFSLCLYRNKNLLIVKIIISLCGFSFVMPSILIIHSVIGIYGINGILNNLINFYYFFNLKSLFGLKGILIAHILLNAPFATRLFFQNLNSISKNYIEIGNSLNLNFWAFLVKVEWPILKQNLISIFSIIFILCFMSFAIVMTLGGGPKTSNIEVAIYQAVLFELNFNKAIILSSIQIFICLILLFIGFYKLKGTNYFEIQINYFEHPFKKNNIIKIFDCLIIILFSIILFSPIIFIIFNFFNSIYYEKIYINKYFFNAFINSVILCLFTSILVTIFGLIISILLVNTRNNLFFQQILFLISSMILVISPIILSFGYFVILGELRYINWIIYLVVIIINFIFLTPFSILILYTRTKNIFLNYDDIKKAYRINEISFLKIIYPLLQKNLFYIFSFSAAISFGDFTIISFFKNESFQTLPVLLYKLIISYRFNEASFVAGFILFFSLFIYLIFDNFFYKGISDKSKWT